MLYKRKIRARFRLSSYMSAVRQPVTNINAYAVADAQLWAEFTVVISIRFRRYIGELWTTDSYVYRKKLFKILFPTYICQVKILCFCLFEYSRLSVRLLSLRLDSIPVDQFQLKEHREKSRKSKSKPFCSIFSVHRISVLCVTSCAFSWLILFVKAVLSLKTIVTLRSYVSWCWRSQYRIGRKTASCKLAVNIHIIWCSFNKTWLHILYVKYNENLFWAWYYKSLLCNVVAAFALN